jgi:predicted CoA-substrate-specific enzyme activase
VNHPSPKLHVLGLDVGAVSLSAVEMDGGGRILRSYHAVHQGDVAGALKGFLATLDLTSIQAVAATASTPALLRAHRRFDNQICLITAARQFHPRARSVLLAGGERFGLVRFDAHGKYLGFKANPLCAAGTGSFLDQQAQRLNLAGSRELADLALANQAPPAKIASRCAVFAKTDMVHAQQEGHSLEAICHGLCRGVAKNIVDSLFAGEEVHGPLLLVGGVARNQAVVRHIRELLQVEVMADGSFPHGAAGAALKLLEEWQGPPPGPLALDDIVCQVPRERSYEFPPLELSLSSYPDFRSMEHSLFHGRVVQHSHPLEVDLYRELPPGSVNQVYLGIDVGSTSTKAVVINPAGEVLAGFYTSTAGRPVVAAQLILEAIRDWEARKGLRLEILGAGTTGAGRKLMGRILGADLILDEITAHARAAVELHPQVDTIIEIGGQDSKFTTLRDGRVTLSVMNSVCAAGTGSFIEEQARRLGLPLTEYGGHTRGCPSPIASERCTVFMERDLNHYLNEGYSKGEVLAAVLHSVRENYLNKVAVEPAIGDTVAFQGATARNRALVAAFEQRIGKPILVSPFCHLTGALGVALSLRDEGVGALTLRDEGSRASSLANEGAGSSSFRGEGACASSFRGLDLHRESIPLRSETCDLCTNHCKLTVAEVGGETVAYGFLCGRDYHTRRFVQNNTSGFDLFKERRRALRAVGPEASMVLSPMASGRNPGAGTDHGLGPGTVGGPHRAKDAGENHAPGFLEGLAARFNNYLPDVLTSPVPESVASRLPTLTAAPPRRDVVVGLPAALHLFEDLPLWRHFFGRLGIRTITSGRYSDAVKDGRILAGAELCAPMTAVRAHVRHLLHRADLVFFPFYLERKAREKGLRRQFCYYSQFAPSLGAGVAEDPDRRRVLTPLVFSLYGALITKAELYRTLRDCIPGGVSPFEVSSAYDEALRLKEEGAAALRAVYRRRALGNGEQGPPSGIGDAPGSGSFHVVLLGRPYTVLSEWMNKGIPHAFASLGVQVFYQDMLPYSSDDVAAIAPLLEDIHWHYAARILEAAEITARTPGAYPVLVTSFKCSPDSFVTQYVREILEAHGKPYLILELDEHDSRLGYETRIEAAVRAFRNHHDSAEIRSGAGAQASPELHGEGPGTPGPRMDISRKTILFPNWDPMSLRLLVAAVRKAGLDARLLEGSEGSMRRSLRHNSGQCTPLNIIAQDLMEYVEGHGLDPGNTVLWMLASSIACNIRLYPHHIRTILRSHGNGFENTQVYVGGMSLQDISATLPFDAYLAYMFGGFVQKMGCRIRPYERHPGETDRVMEEAMQRLEEAFEGDESKEDALAHVVSRLEAIERSSPGRRPEVAIFGDLYARDNHLLNQGLVRFIETHGGEVITTPYTSYAKMVQRPYYWKWFLEGEYLNVLYTGAWMAALSHLEKKYFRLFQRILGEPEPSYDASPHAILSEYNVRVEHTGEAMDNLLKVFYIKKHHPDVALFVQASPAFCCPSLVTEAMAREIHEKTGVPVVSVIYDGTGGSKNEVILPYLEYARRRPGQ